MGIKQNRNSAPVAKKRRFPVPYTLEVERNLNRIQGERQLRDGKKTSLEKIAVEILSTAKG